MYKTFDDAHPKPNPELKQAKPELVKVNSKKGMEEGILWTLSSKNLLSLKAKSRKSLSLIEDVREEEQRIEDPEDPLQTPDDRTTTTPFPIIGVAVPLWVLPGSLLISTIAGAVCMLSVQLRILHLLLHSNVLSIIFGLLYIVTLSCMAYCLVCEPGQMQTAPLKLPDRAHKSWRYEQPIYRYDHYCRWLMNCIGLLNHREFMIMLMGLVAIAVAGACVDVALIIVEALIGASLTEVAIFLHLVYSILKVRFVGEILKMHIGFVSRNELCSEWKEDVFWRVQSTSVFDGKMLKDISADELLMFEEGNKLDGMLVSELSVDTYNAMDPDTNLYDPSLNQYDHGWSHNCWAFWLTPRWTKDWQHAF